MSKTLTEWQYDVWKVSEDHGFHAAEINSIDTKLMLIVSELAEAQDEIRSGHGPTEVYYKSEEPDKPEGFPVELADALIRILDLAEIVGIDIAAMVDLKTAYNETRPYLHGRKF
jgi:NTP pyrophosphatase (non-canonical NTP hydrolase)